MNVQVILLCCIDLIAVVKTLINAKKNCSIIDKKKNIRMKKIFQYEQKTKLIKLYDLTQCLLINLTIERKRK